jgi:SAM-dependent methyltransferase
MIGNRISYKEVSTWVPDCLNLDTPLSRITFDPIESKRRAFFEIATSIDSYRSYFDVMRAIMDKYPALDYPPRQLSAFTEIFPLASQLYDKAGVPIFKQERSFDDTEVYRMGSTPNHVIFNLLWLSGALSKEFANELESELKNFMKDKVTLEIGCGDCNELVLFQSLGAKPYGVELEFQFIPPMMEQFIQKLQFGMVLDGYHDDAFDLVTSVNVFCDCLMDRNTSLMAMKRAFEVLKPGGHIVNYIHFEPISPEAQFVRDAHYYQKISEAGFIDEDTAHIELEKLNKYFSSLTLEEQKAILVSNRPSLSPADYESVGFENVRALCHDFGLTIFAQKHVI